MENKVLTYNDYKAAGFTDKQIQDFLRPKLEESGFSATEVNQYFYRESGDAKLSYLGLETNKNIKDMAKHVADIQYAESLKGKNLDVVDAIKLGFEQSVTGMLSKGRLPTELTEEQMETLNFFERAVMGASSIISDIPVYAAGAKVGALTTGAAGAAIGTVAPGAGNVIGGATGVAVGGTVGAFGFHAAARQILVDMYSRGEVASWDELLYRVKNTSKEFAKGAAVGVATAGAAKVGQVAKTALLGSTMARAQTATGNIVSMSAKMMPAGSEILGLTTASSLVEGHVPTAQDFIDSAVLITGMKGMNAVSNYGKNKLKNKAINVLYDRFVREGKSPLESVKDLQTDPKALESIVTDSNSKGKAPKKAKPVKDSSAVFPGYEDQLNAKITRPAGYDPNVPLPDASKKVEALPKDVEASIDASIKRTDIFNKLGDAAAVPVRLGEIKDKNVNGFYNPQTEVIKIKKAKNLKTLAHEVAHHFENVVFGKTYSDELVNMPYAKEELPPLATKPSVETINGYVGEGFAQFIALYTVNPKLAQKFAPNFFKVFEEQIGPKNPHMFQALKEARAEIQKYVDQPAIEKVLSNISNKEESQLTTQQKWEQIKYNFVTKWLDDKNPIKHAVETLEKISGKKLSFTENAYLQARMFPGWTGRAEAFLEHAPFDYHTLKDIGGVKSLKDIIKDIKNLDEFVAYITSARALELNQMRKIETGIDSKDAEATIEALDKKYGNLFKTKLKELIKYQDAVLQYAVKSGLVSTDLYKTIKNNNKLYVPFQRVVEKPVGSAIGSKTMATKGSPVRKIKGSTRDIINPLESIIKNTFEIINAAERNRVGLSYADLSKLDKSAKFVERLPDKKLKKIITKPGPDGEPDVFIMNQSRVAPDELLVYRNGKPEIYKVDPKVAEVINGHTSPTGKLEALKFLTLFTKTLRAGATGLNLAFAAKNLIRDNIFAFISSKSGYKPFIGTLQNAKIAINKDSAYWELKKAGGSQSSFVSVDRNAMQKALDDLMESNYLNRVWNRAKQVYDSTGKLDVSATRKNMSLLLDRVLDIPALISETSELSTRIGEFRASMKGKEYTRENLERAGYNAREVTLDFAKGGAYSKAVNQFKAFFNANILGAEKVYDVLSTPQTALKAIWALGTLGALTALANYDWEHKQEDQDIKEVLQVQKDTNWVLKVWGTDTIVRIPKPQQIGFISTMFEQLTTDILNNMNDAERDEIAQNLFTAFMRETNLPMSWADLGQIASPTGLTPLVENWANKSMYFGTPIVPVYAEGALPEYQYNDRTTELTKAISRTIGTFVGRQNTISPAKMENIVRGWTGGVGTYLMNVVDLSARKAGIVPDPIKPKDTLEDIPFVRAFTVRHPNGGSQSVTRFYDEFAKRSEYLKAYNIAGRKFDTATMEDLSKYQVYKGLNAIQRSLAEVSSQIRTIYMLPDMSADEKRQNIDALYMTKIAIAQQGLKTMREMDKEVKDSKK